MGKANPWMALKNWLTFLISLLLSLIGWAVGIRDGRIVKWKRDWKMKAEGWREMWSQSTGKEATSSRGAKKKCHSVDEIDDWCWKGKGRKSSPKGIVGLDKGNNKRRKHQQMTECMEKKKRKGGLGDADEGLVNICHWFIIFGMPMPNNSATN